MGNRYRTLVAVALVAAVSACAKGGPPAGARGGGPPPLTVDVGMASRQNIATYLALDGQVAPLQESTLASQQSGLVASVEVNEGARVGAGQVVAKIDDSTLRAQLAQAQAQVLQAQATLASSGLQQPITSQQVSGNVTSAQQGLAQANNSLQSANAALENARLLYNSNNALFKQGYVAQTVLEQSRANYVSAQQQVASAKNAVIQQQAAVQTARQNMGQTGIAVEDTAAKRGALEAARAQVRLLQTQIAQTTITAPFAGVVTARLLDPGAYASPNAPIVRLSQIDAVYVNVNVPDDSLPYVRKGTMVQYTTSSLGNRTFTGTVFDVNAVPTQGTLSYRARIRQENPDFQLRGGMLVSISVRKEFHAGAIVVPRSALFQTDQGANVFTVDALPPPPAGAGGPPAGAGGPPAGGPPGAAAPPPPKMAKARAIPVEVGLQTDNFVEVHGAGINPGVPVITTRPDALQNGSTVVYTAGAPGGSAAGKRRRPASERVR